MSTQINDNRFLSKIRDYINLERDLEDFDVIHRSIEKDVDFKGTNLWILVFAILVASVGLNMNSTAVIIGAMLISPLMGPINGMGYSIATYDFVLFRRALRSFSFAVLAGLIASTAYFAMSPVSTAHSELLARTSPTIYDVLIALFGGMAGIVAISSKNKGNVIPGVAIATALMPPLCTSGYGLATGQFNFFFGALYLFTINTVFIAISSVVFAQIFKFPITSIVDERRKKHTNRIISTVIFITILPSIYFGWGLVKKEQFNERAAMYTRNITVFEGNYLLKSDVTAEKRTIKLIYAGNSLTENQRKRIAEKALEFKLENAQIEIEQGISLSDGTDNNDREILMSEISQLKARLALNKTRQDSINRTGYFLLTEIQALYPQIKACSFAETNRYETQKDKGEKVTLVILSVEGHLKYEDRERIETWAKSRLKREQVAVIFE